MSASPKTAKGLKFNVCVWDLGLVVQGGTRSGGDGGHPFDIGAYPTLRVDR